MMNQPAKAKPRRLEVGFTLVELLVTVVGVLILATLLTPLFGKAIERARGAQCLANLKSLGMGWISYANDQDGRLPSTGWTRSRTNPDNPGIREYVGFPSANVPEGLLNRNTAFTCPVLQGKSSTATKDPYFRTFGVNQLASDVYSAETPPTGLKRRLAAIKRPGQFAIAMDGIYDASRPLNDRYTLIVRNFGGAPLEKIQRPHQGMANVLFADGHVAPTAAEVILDTSPESIFWRDP